MDTLSGEKTCQYNYCIHVNRASSFPLQLISLPKKIVVQDVTEVPRIYGGNVFIFKNDNG